METESSFDIKVGLFVIAGVLLLLSSILVVGGDKVFLSNYVQFKGVSSSAQGLATGSVISLSGIPIGNVRKIVFVEDTDDLMIVFDIEEKFSSRLTTTSSFSIKTQGALGDKFVYIEPGLEKGSPLAEGGIVKNSKRKDLFDVIDSKGEEFGKAADIIVELHKLLLTINEENRSQKLMNSLVDSSKNLNLLIKEAHASITSLRTDIDPKELGATVSHLANIMKKIDKGDGTLGALVNDSAIHHRLLKILGTPERNQYLKPLIRRSIKQGDLVNKSSN